MNRTFRTGLLNKSLIVNRSVRVTLLGNVGFPSSVAAQISSVVEVLTHSLQSSLHFQVVSMEEHKVNATFFLKKIKISFICLKPKP